MFRAVSLFIVAGIAGCASSSTYTIQTANTRDSNERASRYCEKHASIAELLSVERGPEGQIDVYRCISSGGSE